MFLHYEARFSRLSGFAFRSLGAARLVSAVKVTFLVVLPQRHDISPLANSVRGRFVAALMRRGLAHFFEGRLLIFGGHTVITIAFRDLCRALFERVRARRLGGIFLRGGRWRMGRFHDD